MTTCFVLIRLEPGEDPEVLGVFASMETGWHAMDDAMRSDNEASYMLAETEVHQ